MKLRELDKPMVIDADGLYIVTKNLDLVRGYKHVILTPNKNEYQRLADELSIDLDDPTTSEQVSGRMHTPAMFFCHGAFACSNKLEVMPVDSYMHGVQDPGNIVSMEQPESSWLFINFNQAQHLRLLIGCTGKAAENCEVARRPHYSEERSSRSHIRWSLLC